MSRHVILFDQKHYNVLYQSIIMFWSREFSRHNNKSHQIFTSDFWLADEEKFDVLNLKFCIRFNVVK